MLKRYRIKDFNFFLVILLFIICTLGVLLVGSANAELQGRQMIGCVAGFVIMLIIAFIDYSWILNFYWIIYFLNIGLLLWVYLAGSSAQGATRWIQIGGENGFQFQPTELSKILLILFFAMYFMKHQKHINSVKTIVKSIVLILLPLLLIFEQPDLKNTITIGLIFIVLIYVAGLNYKIIGKIALIIAALGISALILITQTDLPIIEDYQKNRIMTFFNSDEEEYSDEALQQNNSVIAIGSGKLTGKGLNNSEVSSNNGNFVSEIDTDFIFAVAGEELGFVGSFCIIIILFLIVFMCIITGKRAKDIAGTIICSGVGSLIAIQSFINICVATGLFPNTGTPLPFISYGLSSVMSLFIGMGFVLNVGLQRKRHSGKLVNKELIFKY
ncbi:MAG TPA: FtsW/RodA/SpoVE family cell cycle protein [Candidatus Alectryocaccobium stercorigallinarum]|nr:FtsW/RodA/SpoVE family cell cycle protein [Candidatus Alectryocaccobium stercorigallinarum]